MAAGKILNSRFPRGLIGERSTLALAVVLIFIISGAAALVQTSYGQTLSDSNQPAPAQPAPQTGSFYFGANFERAGYGEPETSYNTLAVEQADLNMLLATNVPCIRMDIGYAPWLQNNQTAINEITGLVQDVRNAGKCLIIADAASETYRNGGQLTWSQFLAAWVPRVTTLAALYHPNYYEVIKEPGWYVDLVSDSRTNPQFQNVSVWLSLTQNLTNAVHSVSPSTVVGVAVAASSITGASSQFVVQYLNQVQSIPGLGFLGFDIYGPSDQTATQNYLASNPAKIPVWIPEAWSTADGAALDNSPSQDATWIQSLYSFALSIHAVCIIPFYTDDFASYSLVTDPPTNSADILSLFQQRTPVFSAFQSLVAGVPSSSSSTSSSAYASTTSSSSTIASSSQAIHSSSTPSVSTSTSIFSHKAVDLALALVVVLIVVAAFFYFRRRT